MTVYARNDIAAVTISPSAGGCGEIHGRPTPNGAPVRLWALTCVSCEDVLRVDPNWGGQPHQVPETPDEVEIREDLEQRGQVEQAASVAQALKDLAKLGDLPAALAAAMSQFVTSGPTKSSAPAIESLVVEQTTPEPEDEDSLPSENDVAHMSMAQLKNLAVKLNVPTVRSRIEQQKLIYEALETITVN